VQVASSTLAAAILDPAERTPVVRVQVDWARNGSFTDTVTSTAQSGTGDLYRGAFYSGSAYGSGATQVALIRPLDDLSADVVSVSVSRELATDLPPQAKLFAGTAAATATVVLQHQPPETAPEQHTGWYYSPFNTQSPLYGFQRKGAPVRIELGFVTDAGIPEFVRVLTARIRSLRVTSAGRQAVLEAVDGAETMRKQVTIPMIIAEGELRSGIFLRPNLYQAFLVDWVLRKCGYYASPPPRSGCRFLATLNGSAYPEIGRIVEVVSIGGEPPEFMPSLPYPGDPPFVMAIVTGRSVPYTGGENVLRYNLASGTAVGARDGRKILVEGWWQLRSTGVDQPLWIVYRGGGAGSYVSLYRRASDGRFDLTYNRGGGQQAAVAGPSPTLTTGDWFYLAVHVSFTATGVTVTFRHRVGTGTGVTTGPTTTAGTSIPSQEDWDSISLERGRVGGFVETLNDVFVASVQVTSEATAGTWNDAFTPTAVIEPSSTRLIATPAALEEGWSLLQQLAAAEFATAGFDEQGQPYYLVRDRFRRGTALTVQRVLDTERHIEELEVVDAVDQIRNHVVITAESPRVQQAGEVWRKSNIGGIGAGGTSEFFAEFSDPVANLDTSMSYGADANLGSRYLAGTRRDGQGFQVNNLVWSVAQLSPTSARLRVTNPNNTDVWLTADANAVIFGLQPGYPYVVLTGQAVRFNDSGTGSRAEALDQAAIDDPTGPGEQLLEFSAVALRQNTPPAALPSWFRGHQFRQDPDSNATLAADLLFDLRDAGPALLDIPVVGDPRLQLGDRVTIRDPTGLQLDGDYHLSAVRWDADANALRGTVSARAAAVTTALVENYDSGNYDDGTYQ
jgi:hypothetical protein